MAQVLVVSRFPDFLPIIKSGVQRFAAHVQGISAVNLDDPHIAGAVRKADVVVYSTGADAVAKLVAPGTQVFEYRHTPDPGDIERLVVPFVTEASSPADEFVQKEPS